MAYNILDSRDKEELQQSIEERAKVYIGSGEMPDGYNIQIDPNGDEYFEVEQTFNPNSANPQSGIAIEERLKSKVLLNVTLTEEQAGASSVKVAIPNWQLLKKAKQWNVRITYPYAEADVSKSIWHGCTIEDKNAVSYSFCIASGNNQTLTTASKTVFWNIVVFSSPFEYTKGGTSYISFYQTPTPWSRESAANTANAPRSNSYIGLSSFVTENHPPYLRLYNSGNFIFEAGTRIYLEVIL